MLEFTCSTCGKTVQGDDSLAGQAVLCPFCNIALIAPRTTPTTAIATPEHAAQVKVTPQAGSNDGAFSEGLPPLDPSLPPLRQATPHILSRLGPYIVVGSIALILAACIIPAVQKAREAAARTQSTNNLKSIALAVNDFHDFRKRLPFNGTGPAKAGDHTSGSWAFQILPHLGGFAQFNDLDTRKGADTYMCPGRGRPMVSTTGAWSDYCINPFLNDPNGVVNAPDRKLSLEQIADGRSNTISCGHGTVDPNLYSSAVAIPQSTDIFKGGHPATARRSTTNQPDKSGNGELTWGSPFPQGALFCFCDGTVRLLSYSITGGVIVNGTAKDPVSYRLFAAWLTPNGGEVAGLDPD